MTSAYQQQLAQQLRAAEDELGKLRRRVAELTEKCDRQRDAIRWALRMIRRADARHQSTIVEARRQAARAEQAEARIAAVRELHQPVTGCNGWGPDDDPTPGAYGSISQACSACGSQDDAIRWPCNTIRALDASAEAAP